MLRLSKCLPKKPASPLNLKLKKQDVRVVRSSAKLKILKEEYNHFSNELVWAKVYYNLNRIIDRKIWTSNLLIGARLFTCYLLYNAYSIISINDSVRKKQIQIFESTGEATSIEKIMAANDTFLINDEKYNFGRIINFFSSGRDHTSEWWANILEKILKVIFWTAPVEKMKIKTDFESLGLQEDGSFEILIGPKQKPGALAAEIDNSTSYESYLETYFSEISLEENYTNFISRWWNTIRKIENYKEDNYVWLWQVSLDWFLNLPPVYEYNYKTRRPEKTATFKKWAIRYKIYTEKSFTMWVVKTLAASTNYVSDIEDDFYKSEEFIKKTCNSYMIRDKMSLFWVFALTFMAFRTSVNSRRKIINLTEGGQLFRKIIKTEFNQELALRKFKKLGGTFEQHLEQKSNLIKVKNVWTWTNPQSPMSLLYLCNRNNLKSLNESRDHLKNAVDNAAEFDKIETEIRNKSLDYFIDEVEKLERENKLKMEKDLKEEEELLENFKLGKLMNMINKKRDKS